ncbi:phospholipid carrier-dependent glycosyltransferase [Mesonia maritima]|uniref:phospholipid carrier-dependent glycosyltransferase n=1 Tax=Mesonia maritima TaxID=1793873 RepID=UPI003638BBE1
MSDTGKKYLYYLVGIGFLVRLLIFLGFYTHITIFPDSSGYITLAERIMDFNLSGYSGKRSPGYPLLITLGFGNLYAVVFYQFLLGILTSILWYKSLLKLKFSEKFSFGISVFMSTLLNVIFFETAILVESLVLFLISLIIYRFIKFYDKPTNYKTEMVTGFLLGLLTLVKPFYAFLPFLFYALFILRDFKIKKIINKKLILLLFPLIAYFGWSYVNKLNTGYFVSTTFLGLNMAQNCVRFAEKGPDRYNWISEPYVKYREI